jgi:hypothetical protein
VTRAAGTPTSNIDEWSPGSFEEHCINAACLWLGVTGTRGTVSVVASTNAHVDALNRTIQSLRVHVGDLDSTVCTRIGGAEWAMVGDHVVTRRNDRRVSPTTAIRSATANSRPSPASETTDR